MISFASFILRSLIVLVEALIAKINYFVLTWGGRGWGVAFRGNFYSPLAVGGADLFSRRLLKPLACLPLLRKLRLATFIVV
jgi:hypothetical protein